jgi:hypothetical protein
LQGNWDHPILPGRLSGPPAGQEIHPGGVLQLFNYAAVICRDHLSFDGILYRFACAPMLISNDCEVLQDLLASVIC